MQASIPQPQSLLAHSSLVLSWHGGGQRPALAARGHLRHEQKTRTRTKTWTRSSARLVPLTCLPKQTRVRAIRRAGECTV